MVALVWERVRNVHRRPWSPQALALPTTRRGALSRTHPPFMLPQCLPWGLRVLEMMEYRTQSGEPLTFCDFQTEWNV